jgi:hypothetical protein
MGFEDEMASRNRKEALWGEVGRFSYLDITDKRSYLMVYRLTLTGLCYINIALVMDMFFLASTCSAATILAI